MSGNFSAAVFSIARNRLMEGPYDSLGEAPIYEELRRLGEVMRQTVRYWDGGRTATYRYSLVIRNPS